MVQDKIYSATWGSRLSLTSLAASMAVNTLVTGLIVLKICKVFLEVKATSVDSERTSGSLSSTKLRHIIFIIIESGMALFAIQLVRVVLTSRVAGREAGTSTSVVAFNFKLVIGIHEMLNVIIRSVHCCFYCFTDNIYPARVSHQQ